jgi:hypothetical protein
LPNDLAAHNHFHTAVLLSSRHSIVTGYRLILPISNDLDIRGRDAISNKIAANRIGAALRQFQAVFIRPGDVFVTFYGEMKRRVRQQNTGHLGQFSLARVSALPR